MSLEGHVSVQTRDLPDLINLVLTLTSFFPDLLLKYYSSFFSVHYESSDHRLHPLINMLSWCSSSF